MKNFDPALLSFFEKHSLSYDYFEHEAIFTVEQGKQLKENLPGLQTKNLFLTDKKWAYYLVSIESSKRLQINQFRRLVEAKDMTFASAAELHELFGLAPGSVSVFWLIHEPKNLVLYLDQDLWNADTIGRHPNRNDATIIITHDTLVQFLDSVTIPYKVITLPEPRE